MAKRQNHVWSYEFVHDRTEDGRQLKLLMLLDEFSRETLCLHAARHIKARDVIEQLPTLFIERGAPTHIRSDNGPEFIANELRQWLASIGSTTFFIESGSPWRNA
jgi:transposase InsO family protein